VRAARAVVVGPKVDCLAAKGAAVVDEDLGLLDGHCDGMREQSVADLVTIGADEDESRQKCE